MSQEAELPRECKDGISRVRFAPTTDLLAVSSWDSNVRIYDAASPGPSMHSYTLKSAVLDVCWVDNTRVVSGGVDKAVKAFDLGSGAETLIGTHDKAVRCVEHSAETSSVITGSWDKTVRAWDPRTNKCHGVHSQPERVYTMSLSRDKLVVGTAQRHIWVYDLRNMAEPLQKRESSLKYQTRCVAGYPDGAGFAVGSVEGRVAMEYLDMAPEAQARKYAFKCHRTTQDGQDVVYPVNALAFHPIFGTFASGGCDGVVNVWDGANKKRLSQFSKYPTSIASLAFNSTGTSLAVASSYTFEQGAVEHPEDQIFIRPVSEAEVKPKPKGA